MRQRNTLISDIQYFFSIIFISLVIRRKECPAHLYISLILMDLLYLPAGNMFSWYGLIPLFRGVRWFMTCVPNNFFLWYTLYLTKVRRLPLFGTTATTLWYDSYHSVVFLLSSGGIGKIAWRYCIKETGWKSFGGRGGKGNNCLCFLIIKRLTLILHAQIGEWNKV